MLVGILMALLVAVLTGVRSVYSRVTARETDEYVSSWAVRAFAIPAILIVLAIDGVPSVQPVFYPLIVLSGTLGTAATILAMRAYKVSDASLVTPLTALSPALVLITEPILTGNAASPTGIIGVLLLAFGAYFLERGKGEILEPFKKLAKNRGVQFMFGVVAIHAITSPVDQLGVNATGAVFWSLTLHLALTTLLMPIMAIRTDGWQQEVKQAWKPLVFIGVISGLSSVFQMLAITETLVVYVTGLKRLSIPLGVVLAHYMFDDEDNLRGRLLGSLIMVVGTVLIVI